MPNFYQKPKMLKEKFKICQTLTTVLNTPLSVSQIPQLNENVYANSSSIRLIEQIASGCEGIVYRTNTPFIAKIYKQGRFTKRTHEKIKLLLSHNLSCPGICFPTAVLLNSQNEFVGYLMLEAHGKELGNCIFKSTCIQDIFPDWKKKDIVRLCLTILEKIQYLHNRNIIIGDINPANIKVESPTRVYFVDTDSYQVEDFPCPVGTELYTAREIQGRPYSSFLRTFGNEYFSVATLLFMIMFLGETPYSVKNGNRPRNYICNMNFLYPLNENSTNNVPEDQKFYIWSHLPFSIKEGFYQTFQKDEKHSSESTRLTTLQWIRLFDDYYSLLINGTLGDQDKMSEELIPTRSKQISGKRNYG